MRFDELAGILAAEKQTLLGTVHAIIGSYQKIADSLFVLRDKIFANSFASNKDTSRPEPASTLKKKISLIPYDPPSLVTEPEHYNTILTAILGNLKYLEEDILGAPDKIELKHIDEAGEVKKHLEGFLHRLFGRNTAAPAAGSRNEYAVAVRMGITNAFQQAIQPFWDRLALILRHGYQVHVRQAILATAGNYPAFQAEPFKYEKEIREKLKENGLNWDQEAYLGALSSLGVPDTDLIEEIQKSVPPTPEKSTKPSRVFRLKEVVQRYLAQYKHLIRLYHYLEEVQLAFAPLTFWEKIVDFMLRFFTNTAIQKKRAEILFTYTSLKGKFGRREGTVTRLQQLTRLLADYMENAKDKLEHKIYSRPAKLSDEELVDLERLVDSCGRELETIFEQANGLREWLARNEKRKHVEKIAARSQEDFASLLVSINHAVIINDETVKENLADFPAFSEAPTQE